MKLGGTRVEYTVTSRASDIGPQPKIFFVCGPITLSRDVTMFLYIASHHIAHRASAFPEFCPPHNDIDTAIWLSSMDVPQAILLSHIYYDNRGYTDDVVDVFVIK